MYDHYIAVDWALNNMAIARMTAISNDIKSNDKIDSQKLVHLLRSGLLKIVYHSGDDFIYLRKLISGYEDLIKSGVRAKNQRSALFRASQKNSKEETTLANPHDSFVLEGLDRTIIAYENEKQRYESEF